MPLIIDLAGESIPTDANALKSFHSDETLIFGLGLLGFRFWISPWVASHQHLRTIVFPTRDRL
jgi:hypothetical protein